MKTAHFPWIALGIGLILALALVKGGAFAAKGSAALPLLTLLFMAEFGFFVTGAGAVTGIRHWLGARAETRPLYAGLGAAILSIGFLFVGFFLWNGYVE